ncbi:hypothetical protein [Reyranella sp.]|uniref:hypothetical protein n=1 Tax=Reyranella sp. TaxID=1929291 RepID=UPI002F94F85D
MGKLMLDRYVGDIQAELNFRFSPGDPLKEMIALQREFAMFSNSHTLMSAAALLNLAPSDPAARRGWFTFLANLRRVPSDRAGVNGHNRIRSVLRTNLLSPGAKPVHFTHHSVQENRGVLVSTGAPLVFSRRQYLIISAPVT